MPKIQALTKAPTYTWSPIPIIPLVFLSKLLSKTFSLPVVDRMISVNILKSSDARCNIGLKCSKEGQIRLATLPTVKDAP